MPTKLDFNSTKEFRNKILGRTLPVENGPKSQTEDTYRINTLTDFPNIDQPPVDANRTEDLTNVAKVNTYKPNEYFIRDEINTLPRRANLALYPYFTSDRHTYIGILTSNNFDTESELMKFAQWNIKENPEGPFYSRIAQNLETSTVGKIRLIDALEGNLSSAVNIVTGKEPLIESNNKITVAKTLPGKGIDFLQTVTGVEFPWTEIPGDYLSNPENPIVNRPNAKTTLGQLNQDITGALGSLLGIQRRPDISQKPSDLFIEYMGSGQRQNLYDNISYSKYGPNYTTTARSQNSSKVFNFVDSLGQNINKFFGAEAPDTIAYIGDDRGNDVKFSMSDFNGRPVKSSFYLSLLFDPIQARLFQREKNLSENGPIGGKLTWISSVSKNKLGSNNNEWSGQKGGFEDTKSTNFLFREDSILGKTQEILESMPTNGSEMRSHVANVIDQTSRLFKDGDILMSRGSNIKYVDKFGEESGVEYCRAWTKDRSYLNYSDTMKRTGTIRKFDSSVLSTPWNINIAPMSNGNKTFDGSTNMFKKGDGFYAKKYMFSFENLAWKTSNIPGFTYNDLPYCERGSNGGRVMWFPPYDLKISEQNNARWDANTFLGRPEPIYTYQNTERNGTLSFKVIVDHPSILNLLVREHFKGMSDEESENYINAFFAGCEELDFYDLIRRYSTITPDEAKLLIDYLNGGKDEDTISRNKFYLDPVEQNEPGISPSTSAADTKLNVNLKFLNDRPEKILSELNVSPSSYQAYFNEISNPQLKDDQINRLTTEINNLVVGFSGTTSYAQIDRDYDLDVLFNRHNIDASEVSGLMADQSTILEKIISNAITAYSDFTTQTTNIVNDIKNDLVTEITIHLLSSTSAIADDDYNKNLSLRRSHSVLKEILDQIRQTTLSTDKWSDGDSAIEFTFKELGFTDKEGKIIITTQSEGENYNLPENSRCGDYRFINKTLRVVAPVAYECRQTQVVIIYTKKPQNVVDKPQDSNDPNWKLKAASNDLKGDEPITTRSKPPLDMMKYIIMKTLSECHYFQKLEETDPVVFGSLKEKFKFFHPGFHSMTPEGLNARLTFLNQCVRPGDTIPIKGVNSSLDLRARNTSFGPPPICILRVGDFYHSKVIVRDVNISFEESPWDLNPEGIGIQPMIASVQMQISFIGGQGLEKPVNWLQNALTSNFYANTEMYDPRSITTNETIGGRRYEEFTKEFINSLMDNSVKNPEYVEPNMSEKTQTGEYIGDLRTDSISYSSSIYDVFTSTYDYVTKYAELYNQIIPIYGKNISSILLSPNYRKNNVYNYYTINSETPTELELFGLYEKGRDLFILSNMLEKKLLDSLSTINVLNMFRFNKYIPINKVQLATRLLNEYLVKFIKETIDEINQDTNLKSIEENRDKLILSLDKVNFIVKYGFDAKLDETKTTGTRADFNGFTSNMIYDEYSSCISYIVKNSTKFYEDLDTSINYSNVTLTLSDEQFTNIMKDLLSTVSASEFMNNTFGIDPIVFDTNLIEKLKNAYNKFINITPKKEFKFTKFIERINDNDVIFEIVTESLIDDTNIINELIDLNKVPTIPINQLNYYKIK